MGVIEIDAINVFTILMIGFGFVIIWSLLMSMLGGGGSDAAEEEAEA